MTPAAYTLGEMASDRRWSTGVDSALGGSQDEASFFSAPVSLPASGPRTTTSTSQNTSTSHLVRRPAGRFSIDRNTLITCPLVSSSQSRTPSRAEDHRNAGRQFKPASRTPCDDPVLHTACDLTSGTASIRLAAPSIPHTATCAAPMPNEFFRPPINLVRKNQIN